MACEDKFSWASHLGNNKKMRFMQLVPWFTAFHRPWKVCLVWHNTVFGLLFSFKATPPPPPNKKTRKKTHPNIHFKGVTQGSLVRVFSLAFLVLWLVKGSPLRLQAHRPSESLENNYQPGPHSLKVIPIPLHHFVMYNIALNPKSCLVKSGPVEIIPIA